MWSISKLNKNFLGGILMKKIVNLFVVVGFIISIANFAFAEQTYRLENVVIFSRHNVRSPTVSGSKILTQVTNRKWIKWKRRRTFDTRRSFGNGDGRIFQKIS